MPIYEYRCPSCRRRTTTFVRTFSSPVPAAVPCSHCNGEASERVFSTFAIVRSEESRLETLEDLHRWGLVRSAHRVAASLRGAPPGVPTRVVVPDLEDDPSGQIYHAHAVG